MAIDVTCPDCGASQAVGEEKAGLRLRCRNCSAIVSIPAREADAIGKITNPRRGPSPPRRSAPRNFRPAIYAVVGCFAVLALLFRWWFNPPRAEPVAPMPIQVVADASELPGHTLPRVSEPTASVLTQAREEFLKNTQSERFMSLLRSVAGDLPELELSTEPAQPVWNRTTLFEHGLYLNAFRLTSPLDADGDLFWCFATTEKMGGWNILSVSGEPTGCQIYHPFSDVEIEGLDLPRNASFVAQELRDRTIRARQSLIVYFSAADNNPVPFRAAARVLPARPDSGGDDRRQLICKQLGLSFLPKPASTPGSRVLEGHTNYATQIAWLPDGKLLSIDVNGDILKWDGAGTSPISKIATGRATKDAAISSDGRWAVLMGPAPWEIELWDIGADRSAGKVPFRIGEPTNVCFAPDGNTFYVAYRRRSNDRTGEIDLVRWSVEDFSVVATRGANDFGARQIQFTPRGPRLIGQISTAGQEPGTGTRTAAIAQYSADLEVLPRLTLLPETETIDMCPVQGGTWEFMVDDYGQARLVDLSTESKPAHGFALPEQMNTVGTFADDRFVVVATRQGAVRLFDSIKGQICMTWTGHTDAVVRLRLSPDGTTLATASKDGTIRLWDASQRSRSEQNAYPLTDSQGHEFKSIPAGRFVMGSHPKFVDRTKLSWHRPQLINEGPQRPVSISRRFLMAAHEVTVEQFQRFVDATGYVTTVQRNKRGGRHIEHAQLAPIRKPHYTWQTPGYQQNQQHPVVQVTWEDAHAYCAWLSEIENAIYRLPTEAEWEYACAGDADTQLPFFLANHSFEVCTNCADASLLAAYRDEFYAATQLNDGYAFSAPVGTYLANQHGLSEMLGNVWELCEDSWAERYDLPRPPDEAVTDPIKRGMTNYVCRGGSFFCNPQDARSCRRSSMEADEARSDVGFRIVREVSP